MSLKLIESIVSRMFFSLAVISCTIELCGRTFGTTLWLIYVQSFITAILMLYIIFRISLWGAKREEKKCRKQRMVNLMAELRMELLSDKILYNAFSASIKSAIEDTTKTPSGMTDEELARHIADRIIGRE